MKKPRKKITDQIIRTNSLEDPIELENEENLEEDEDDFGEE